MNTQSIMFSNQCKGKKKDLKLENDSPFTCTKNEHHELHGKEKCYDLR